MNIYRSDIQSTVSEFTKDIDKNSRYASYDYCHNYFHPQSKICITDDMEKSCLALGFYLASWGMYRGSSFLLKKSMLVYSPVIDYIASLDKNVWDIDAHNLNEHTDELIEIYEKLRCLLIKPNAYSKTSHLTLTTKIMLGVFGSVPAYDTYFIKTFKNIFSGECGFSGFNNKSLKNIYKFYEANKHSIDKQRLKNTHDRIPWIN